MIKRIISLERNIISSLENSRIPFIYFIFTFLFAATLRNFLEIFSSKASMQFEVFTHYYLSYAALAMTLILLFYILTRTDILKIAKIILPSFIIIILAPLLDLILSLGKGHIITYLLPGKHNNLILRYFTFFGNFTGMGITPGMKIEIAIILLASFTYFYIKNSKLIKSFLFTILTYTLIFGYCASPFLMKKILEIMGLEYESSNLLFINFYLLFIFLIGVILMYLKYKNFFKIIIKDVRPFRLLHFELMFALGLILGINYSVFNLTAANIFHFIFIPISIAFAWVHCVISNNIEDYNIDKISNRERPLIKYKINTALYRKISWFLLLVSLIYAIAVNYQTFFIILLFAGNYFLYSMYPLRLKRVLLLSKLLISFNSLILVILGFITVSALIHDFPKIIIAIFLIGLTSIINFIDIKDYKGDKKAGIKTLPVVLGLKKGKFAIGIFFILAYLSICFIIREIYIVVSFFLLGIIQFFLINKRNYKESDIFFIYLVSITILFFYLLSSP